MGELLSNYYSILNVTPSSSMKDIKKAYRKLVLKYHPDVNKDPDAEEKFKDITKAFKVLSNPKARLKYDVVLEKEYGKKDNVIDINELIKKLSLKIKSKSYSTLINISKDVDKISIDKQTLSLDVNELGKRLIESNNSFVKKVASKALINKDKKNVYHYILHAIKNENNEEMIIYYLKLIKNRFGKKIIYDLQYLKDKKSSNIKLSLIELIEFNYCSKGAMILKEFLEDKNELVRLKAMEILYKYDPDVLLDKIYYLIEDDNDIIRKRASIILDDLKKKYRKNKKKG